MAEYLAVEFNGVFNTNKQKIELEDTLILAPFIDKLRFNTLECDINKPINPLNFITEWSYNLTDGLTDLNDGLLDLNDGFTDLNGTTIVGTDLYKFYGKNSLLTDDPQLLTTINSNGNLYTTGTITSGSDDRIKSNEIEIQNATETLLKLTPKIYDKHPSVKFSEDEEDNDLTNIQHFKESGLVAQEVLKDAIELEHLVVKPKIDNELFGLNYIGLYPLLN